MVHGSVCLRSSTKLPGLKQVVFFGSKTGLFGFQKLSSQDRTEREIRNPLGASD